MKQAVKLSELAIQIAAIQGVGFDKALEQARALLSAQEAFIEAHLPAKGKTVVCKDNQPIDPGYTQCLTLKVENKYIVTGENEHGMIFVQDEETGEKIGHPFHKVRFEAVVD